MTHTNSGQRPPDNLFSSHRISNLDVVMENEKIDVYDDSLMMIGSMERKQAHRTGALHKSVHCWFVDSQFVFFQIRGADAGFPRLLDATVGGHLASGESEADALRREGVEEVGVEIDISALTPIGTNLLEFRVNDSFVREFSEVYMLHARNGLESFTPNPAELLGIVGVPFRDGHSLLEESVPVIKVDMIGADSSSRKIGNMEIRKDSFIPFDTAYFLRILETGERYARGERNLSV